MSNKEKIKEEIERLSDEYPMSRGLLKHLTKFIDSLPEEHTGGGTIKENYNERYKRIAQTEQFKKSYCDKSLGKEESASEDLEKEIDEEIDNLCELGCYMEDLAKGNSEGVYPLPDNVVKELRKFARHFVEWQRRMC